MYSHSYTMGNNLSNVNVDNMSIEDLKALQEFIKKAIDKKKNANLQKPKPIVATATITQRADVPKIPVATKVEVAVADEEMSASKRESKSMQPNESFHHERTGVAKIAVLAGVLSPTKVDSKILLVNESSYSVTFVVSSDPHAQQFGSGKLGANLSGGEMNLELSRKNVINQRLSLHPGQKSEIICRTKHAYVTVARLKSTKEWAVYRYRREVSLGATYAATKDMVDGPESDIRPSDFMDEFK